MVRGLIGSMKLGGVNSRPMIALPAAARSSGVSDIVPHLLAAEDRR